MLQIFENSQIGMSRHVDTSSTTQNCSNRGKYEDPVVPLERNLHGHPLAGLLWERQFEKLFLEFEWERVPIWRMLFVHRKPQLFFRYMWTILKMAWKKAECGFMWKKLMKHVDLDQPTSFLDDVHLGCTQRECKPNGTMKEKYKEMFESRISASAIEKLPGWEKSHAKTVAWSYDMEGHAQKCVERYCEIANKKTEQLYEVSSLVWNVTKSRKRSLNQNYLMCAHKLSQTVCIWPELVDQTFYRQSTNLQEHSQSGLKLVTDVGQIDFLHSSYT